VHWNGQHWRVLPEELKLRSHITERYGKSFIPDGMTIQDFGVTYEELEPCFDEFERVCGTSGKRATGVTYFDGQGREVFQPADLVVLSAFQLNNTKLLLLRMTFDWKENDIHLYPALQANDAAAATNALREGATGMRGAQVYLDNCNACHRSDGSGANRTFPSLIKNEAVNAKDPISLIHLVLAGSAMPSTRTAPSAIAMPELGWRLTDQELADVLSFVRSSWGNHAPGISSGDVGRVRKTLCLQHE
jgi:mono/diheme cytochrome c family protein